MYKIINNDRYKRIKVRSSGINTYQKIDESGNPIIVKRGSEIIDYGILLIKEKTNANKNRTF
jgi:hypothetical protein